METKLEIKCQRNKYNNNYYVIEIESRTYFSDVDFGKIQGAIDTIKNILDPLIEKELKELKEKKEREKLENEKFKGK